MVEHAPGKSPMRAAALQREIDLLGRIGPRFCARDLPVGEVVEIGFEMGRQRLIPFRRMPPDLRAALPKSSAFSGICGFYVASQYTTLRCDTSTKQTPEKIGEIALTGYMIA
jgi:hypothetical protein